MIKNKEDLKKYLEENSITQSDFARKIDKDISLITRWLNGERNIPNNINILLGLEKGIVEQNLIKNVCKKLGLTYAQLAEQIGYSEPALKTSVSTNKISNSMKKAIELYLKTIKREDLFIFPGDEVVKIEENLVKRACLELGITQRELAEILGNSKPTIERWSQSGEIPESSKRHINLLIENKRLVEALETKEILESLKEFDFTSLSYNDLKEIKNIIYK